MTVVSAEMPVTAGIVKVTLVLETEKAATAGAIVLLELQEKDTVPVAPCDPVGV